MHAYKQGRDERGGEACGGGVCLHGLGERGDAALQGLAAVAAGRVSTTGCVCMIFQFQFLCPQPMKT